MIKLKVAWIAGLFCGIALGLPACGGGGPTGPQPLKYTFEARYIAPVPAEEQSSVVDASSALTRAQLSLANAENAVAEWGTQISLAKNQRKAVELEESSARARKARAEESGDMNRVNAANREIRAAEIQRKAADAKVEYYKAQLKYLKKKVTYAKAFMYYKKAERERAKAQVAVDKNIRPKGFVFANYTKQVKLRLKEMEKYKIKADKEKAEADVIKAKWQKLQAQADKLRGGPSPTNGTGTTTGTGTGTTTGTGTGTTTPPDTTTTPPDTTTTPDTTKTPDTTTTPPPDTTTTPPPDTTKPDTKSPDTGTTTQPTTPPSKDSN